MYFHPLNFIRFILALGVVFFHYGTQYYPFSSGPLHTLIVHSGFRVSFFFFISGFVMMLVYGRQANALKPLFFYKKRLSRILPMYWLAFLVTLLLVMGVNGASPKGLVIILHFLGLQSFHSGYVLDLNFPTWSISVELFFYALFPFLAKWMIKLPVKKLLLSGIFLWALQSVQHVLFVDFLWNGSKGMEEFINAFPVWHLVTFICGMATAGMITLDVIPQWFRKNSLLFFSFAIFGFVYVIFIPNGILKYIHNGLLVPLFILLVVALFYDRSLVNRFLCLKAVSRLGDLSYSLFIFQYPVWIVCTALSTTAFTGTTMFFMLYLGLLLALSWLINRYFEKPALRYLRRSQEPLAE